MSDSSTSASACTRCATSAASRSLSPNRISCGGDRVVLVHDRDHAERQQPFQRPHRVAVVPAPVQVIGGQQHLPDGQPVPGEGGGVPLGQQQLPDAGRRLLGGQVSRAGLQPQRRDAGRDRAGGHQHHLLAGRPASGQRVDQRVQPGRFDPAARWSARTSRPSPRCGPAAAIGSGRPAASAGRLLLAGSAPSSRSSIGRGADGGPSSTPAARSALGRVSVSSRSSVPRRVGGTPRRPSRRWARSRRRSRRW